MKANSSSLVTAIVICSIVLVVVVAMMTSNTINKKSQVFDSEREGVLTHLEVVDGGESMIINNGMPTEVDNPDTYYVHFDDLFKYKVSKQVAFRLHEGDTYTYMPQRNGELVKIKLGSEFAQ